MSYLLTCFQGGPKSTILYDILKEIENKDIEIQDIRDVNFFITAMDVCYHHLNDKELAKRLNNLLLKGNNYNFIGDSYNESIYYRLYVSLLCRNEPIDEFFENVYYKLVPHIYVPEPSVMAEILEAVEANGTYKYIPKLWSDMIIFDHLNRKKLIEMILSIISENVLDKDDPLLGNFAKIGWDIYSKIDSQGEDRIYPLK